MRTAYLIVVMNRYFLQVGDPVKTILWQSDIFALTLVSVLWVPK